jgi:hypothetical protein
MIGRENFAKISYMLFHHGHKYFQAQNCHYTEEPIPEEGEGYIKMIFICSIIEEAGSKYKCFI